MLPALAAELVRLNSDFIVSRASPTTTAAKMATTKIPLLFLNVGDPVGSCFVASLAKPGGNLTGFGGLGTVLQRKQLELLQELNPSQLASRCSSIGSSRSMSHARAEIEAFARQRGWVIRKRLSVSRDRTDALLIFGTAVLSAGSRACCPAYDPAQAARRSAVRDRVKAGSPMSYGNRLTDDVKRLPYLMERIVNGTKQ